MFKASLFFALVGLAVSKTVDVTLDVVNAKTSPDGFVRNSITANGTYPGPLIKANKGDTLRVTVNNKLTDPTMRRSTSMDFDGLFFNTDNSYNEGTPFVTNCPIGPNTSFTHEIPLVNNQTGTYWYHSQLSVQYLDGLRGPLIIYDPDDPHKDLYDVDDESTIIQLADWWHNASLGLLATYTATGLIPVADSGVMNGAGRYVGGPEVPFAVQTVTPGLRHRLRVISQAVRGEFTMSVDAHNLTIIAIDGVPTTPHTVASLDILPGQRYDLILDANQPVGNYWINLPYVGGSAAANPNFNISFSRGILRYAGAAEEDPTEPMTTTLVEPELVEADLVPLVNEFPKPNQAADINITLTLVVTTGKAQWNVNNVSYLSPVVPTLVKVLAGKGDEPADFNITENTFILPRNKVVDVTFPPNDDDDAHPIHLHGNNFWVVKSNSSDVMNLVNPPRRDVAAAGAAGATFRFVTDNPGPWFFHCHIFWHMNSGLATVMLMDPETTEKEVRPTDAWKNLCPAYDRLPADLQ